MMKKKRKRKYKLKPFIVIALVLVVIIVVVWYFFFREKEMVVTVVSEIDGYNYYLDSNETRIYKKYYKELESELEDNKVDEKNYAELISKLFVIDFYTLSNKLTNQDVGGIQFIHTNVQEKFKLEASSTVYKYVKNNLSGNRKQKLPEVKKVEILSNEMIKYDETDYYDDSAYQLKLKVNYVKDLDYPEEVVIKLIHEENKLSIIEVES